MFNIEIKSRIDALNPWLIDFKKGITALQQLIPSKYFLRNLENIPVFHDRAF